MGTQVRADGIPPLQGRHMIVCLGGYNDGIIEAQQNCYDDALIFMECSGQEQFKSKLMSLRTVYHDTCTIISPKIITKAEFNKPETITVSGRSKGTAQYIGEFKMYDTYTGKYYWCQPIGDVGVNLARIMEKKLGGIAPAGTNDSSGLGGVLSRAVLDKKWDFSDDALRIMDEKGLNPITYDAKNGLMMLNSSIMVWVWLIKVVDQYIKIVEMVGLFILWMVNYQLNGSIQFL